MFQFASITDAIANRHSHGRTLTVGCQLVPEYPRVKLEYAVSWCFKMAPALQGSMASVNVSQLLVRRLGKTELNRGTGPPIK